LALEAIRIDRYLQRKYPHLPSFGIAFLVILTSFAAMLVFVYLPTNADLSLNVHAQHIEIAKEAQNGNANISGNFANLPGLSGDKTRRFTVSFLHPDTIQSQQDTELRFEVYDANTGTQVGAFQKIYEKLIHLVIVDSQLQYFQHIHPTQEGKDFVIKFQFPK